MPRITVYSDGVLIADSGAVVAPPVTPPVTPPVVPPVTPPVTNHNYTVLTPGKAAKISLGPKQSAYFQVDTSAALKSISAVMASVDQAQDCNMILTTDAGQIDSLYDTMIALYAKNNAWGGVGSWPTGPNPIAWCRMSHATSGESVTIQTQPLPKKLYIRVTNEGTATATNNIGVSLQ